MECKVVVSEPFAETDFVFVLIREDLKSNRLFSALRTVNLEDDFFQTDFSPIVFACLGVHDLADHWNEVYGNLIETHCKLPELTNKAFCKEAIEVYRELERLVVEFNGGEKESGE